MQREAREVKGLSAIAGGPVRQRASVAAALRHAWDADAFRVDDVIEAAGLTRSTAIAAVDELIELGLVRELPNARADGAYRLGRPARRFELRADAAVVVGLDAGQSSLTCIVADLAGTEITRNRVPVDPDDDSTAERRAALARAVDRALDDAGRPRSDVLAVGVGVPAPVDRQGASPPHPGGFWERMNPDLAGLFADWAPIVRVENDATLAAVAEGSVGVARDCDSFVALLAGTRLGAGVVVDGHVLRGAHGGVGELDGLRWVDGVDGTDGLGHRLVEWTLELRRSAAIPADHPLTDVPDDRLNAGAILAAVSAADPVGRALIDRAGRLLARVTNVLAGFYDPQVVVVSGAIPGVDLVLDAASGFLSDELVLPPPRIVASELGGAVVAVGAVAAARHAARDRVLLLDPARAPGRLAARP